MPPADPPGDDRKTSPTALEPEVRRVKITEWLELYGDALLGYALRYLKSRDQAEEIVHDAFIAAFEALPRFEGRSQPKTWLISILRHKIMDLYRRRAREPVVQDSSRQFETGTDELFDSQEHWRADTQPLNWRDQPETAFRNREFMKALEGCLRNLPERFRAVFLMREIEGLDTAEISKECDLSHANLRVILHRARLGLQQCLQLNWLERT